MQGNSKAFSDAYIPFLCEILNLLLLFTFIIHKAK